MTQKKYLYGLLIGLLCLNACSNDMDMTNDEDSGDNIQLSFNIAGVENDLQTRASAHANSGGNFEGALKLYVVEKEGTAPAVYDPFKFANVPIFTITSGTAYNTKKKWPSSNGTLVFYAFAPATAAAYASNYPTTEPKTTGAAADKTYTAGTNAAGSVYEVKAYASQEDLLFGKTIEYNLASVPAGGVPIVLKHTLSRITFQITTAGFDTDEEVYLKSLQLTNIPSKAQGTFGNGIKTPATAEAIATGFNWSAHSDKITYTMGYSGYSPKLGDETDWDDVGYVNPGNGDSMFLFPHENSAFDANAQLIITYKIKSEANDRVVPYPLNKMESNAHRWGMGLWTNYRFTIKANYITLNPITVASWGVANPVGITVE